MDVGGTIVLVFIITSLIAFIFKVRCDFFTDFEDTDPESLKYKYKDKFYTRWVSNVFIIISLLVILDPFLEITSVYYGRGNPEDDLLFISIAIVITVLIYRFAYALICSSVKKKIRAKESE